MADIDYAEVGKKLSSLSPEELSEIVKARLQGQETKFSPEQRGLDREDFFVSAAAYKPEVKAALRAAAVTVANEWFSQGKPTPDLLATVDLIAMATRFQAIDAIPAISKLARNRGHDHVILPTLKESLRHFASRSMSQMIIESGDQNRLRIRESIRASK